MRHIFLSSRRHCARRVATANEPQSDRADQSRPTLQILSRFSIWSALRGQVAERLKAPHSKIAKGCSPHSIS